VPRGEAPGFPGLSRHARVPRHENGTRVSHPWASRDRRGQSCPNGATATGVAFPLGTEAHGDGGRVSEEARSPTRARSAAPAAGPRIRERRGLTDFDVEVEDLPDGAYDQPRAPARAAPA
jgi:hypothetical protein